MTGNALVRLAYRSIGIVGIADPVDADLATEAREFLAEILDTWATERLTMHSLRRTVKPLGSGIASYTIGVGGDINIPRPTTIESAALIQDVTVTAPVEVPIAVLSDQQWEAIALKTFEARYAQGVYYDATWTAGLGRVWLYPVPVDCGDTSLVLYTPEAIAGFTDLTTDYTFPPGYARALRFALARDLAVAHGRPWSPDLEQAAVNALADVKRLNDRPMVLGFDPALAGPGSAYNIYSDE